MIYGSVWSIYSHSPDSNSLGVTPSTSIIFSGQSKEVGDTVNLQVERDGKVISCEVTLGESTQSTATAESGN